MEGEKTTICNDKQRMVLRAAREHFRLAVYGKYDLIQPELSADFLLNDKPRVIKKLICKKFGLSPDEINQDTFWSWLRRTRKDLRKKGVNNSHGKIFIDESTQHTEQINDWKSFTPTAPKMQNEVIQQIIKLVAPTASINH
jgi:hypothetical protein